jgi:hypothetical protein
MPHVLQNVCFAIPVLNVYVVMFSPPFTSRNFDFGTMRCRKPVIAQRLQLQSCTRMRSGASTSKRTAPQ